MIPSKRNQIGNLTNEYEDDAFRVFCVSFVNLLRNPTITDYLTKVYSFNTKACDMSEEYTLIVISQALTVWVNEIHYVTDSLTEVFE